MRSVHFTGLQTETTKTSPVVTFQYHNGCRQTLASYVKGFMTLDVKWPDVSLECQPLNKRLTH